MLSNQGRHPRQPGGRDSLVYRKTEDMLLEVDLLLERIPRQGRVKERPEKVRVDSMALEALAQGMRIVDDQREEQGAHAFRKGIIKDRRSCQPLQMAEQGHEIPAA